MKKLFEKTIIIFNLLFFLLILSFTFITDNLNIMYYITFVLLFSLLIFLFKIELCSKKTFLLLVMFSIVIRLVYILVLKIEPKSDFLTYYVLAQDIMQNNPLSFPVYISVFPHVIGYSVFLGIFFKLFGYSVLIAQLLNILLFGISLQIFYKILSLHFAKKFVYIGTILFSFIPSYISFSTILGTEWLFNVLFLLIIYLFLKFQKEKEKNVYKYLVLGLLIGVSNYVRPSIIIVLLAIVICLILNVKHRPDILPNLKLICLVMIGSFIIQSSVNYLIENNIDRDIRENTGMLYSINTGLNPKYYGIWNLNDAKLVDEAGAYKAETNNTQINNIIKTEINNKIVEILKNPINFGYNKYKIMWGSDDFPAIYNKNGLVSNNNPNFIYQVDEMTNSYYFVLILFVTFFMCKIVTIGKYDFHIIFVSIVFILYFCMFTIVEVFSRYHFSALPLFIYIMIFGLSTINFNNKKETIINHNKRNDDRSGKND